MAAYSVNIIGLSNKEHQFQFEMGDEFFRKYGTDLVSSGTFRADIVLDKRETLIEAQFNINGIAKLVCDRSLEPFDFPLEINTKIVFKYGEEFQEMTDEIVIIPRDAASLEIGQYMYEFISLGIPLKKLHPNFQDEADDDDSEGRIVYSSGTDEEKKDDEDIDPRWNILKKLK